MSNLYDGVKQWLTGVAVKRLLVALLSGVLIALADQGLLDGALVDELLSILSGS
jgi:hypothetical protein